jgi:hypothetical protein
MTRAATWREKAATYLRSPTQVDGQRPWTALLVGITSLAWAVARAVDAVGASGTWPLLWRWSLTAFLAAVAVLTLGGEVQRWRRSQSR